MNDVPVLLIKVGAAALKREAAWIAADLSDAGAQRCAAAVLSAVNAIRSPTIPALSIPCDPLRGKAFSRTPVPNCPAPDQGYAEDSET